jgi:hypothetical protein
MPAVSSDRFVAVCNGRYLKPIVRRFQAALPNGLSCISIGGPVARGCGLRHAVADGGMQENHDLSQALTMQTIHKYRLPLSGEVEMPDGARVLSVAAEHDEPCLWALVDTEAPMTRRRFAAIGTGHAAGMTKYGTYVGVYRLSGERGVYHVFELKQPG